MTTPTSNDRPSSPTPSERATADAEAKAKETAEQALLPYQWTQTIKDLDITVAVDGKYKGRDLDVQIKKTRLKVAVKGQDAILDVGCDSPRGGVLGRDDEEIEP